MKPTYTKQPAKWLKSHGFTKRKDGIWIRTAFQWVDWCEPVIAGKRGWLIEVNPMSHGKNLTIHD